MLRGLRMARNAAVHYGLFFLMVFATCFAHQRHFDGPTSVSRLDLLHSLISMGTIAIDHYHENTSDKAFFNGHYYSDKAPGTSFLALPAFAAACIALYSLGISPDSNLGWLVSSWVACAGALAVVAALGAVALFDWLSRRVPARVALLATLTIFLGAAPLPYATMMFSHSLVAALVAIALWAVWRQGEACPIPSAPGSLAVSSHPALSLIGGEGLRRAREGKVGWLGRHRWDVLAGFACGWAVASEYTAGLVVLGVFVWLLSQHWRRAIPFVIGAVLPLLLIPAYSWACLGTPFALPYSYQAIFPQMKHGLYAIQWPDPETALRLLLGPTRGLFFWSPFLVMAWLGFWKLAQTSASLFWLTYAAPVVQIVIISGRVWDWQAGPAFGARYLTPMLPLLALPCALGVQRFPKIGIVLAAYSIGVTTMATLIDACPDGDIYNPLTEIYLPRLLKGDVSPNLGTVMGLNSHLSAALYYALLMGGIWWLWRIAGAKEPRGDANVSAAVDRP